MGYQFNIIIGASRLLISQKNIELVERKGIGHPDSLSELIAENVCQKICEYYRKKYSSIYRFNINQVEIIGGDIEVDFGKGKIIKKGNIKIFGKATCLMQRECETINNIALNSVEKLLVNIFNKNFLNFFKIESNITKYSERNIDFFKHHEIPLSEDTSIGVGFYPFTFAEKLALDIETMILKISKGFPVGKDMKIMVINNQKDNYIEVIISLAFLGKEIKSINEYFLLKEKIKTKLLKYLDRSIKQKFKLVINAADNKNQNKAFITLSGTAAEYDQGSLGRGNRTSGLIIPFRPVSSDIIQGKNPVYNVGKIYNLLAFYLAKRISERVNKNSVEVSILSKLGNPINKPQVVSINISGKLNESDEKKMKLFIYGEFKKLFQIIPNTNYTKFTEIILKQKNYLYI